MMYTGAKLREISFPLGGIGTGSIGLTGNGSFSDWEIFNRPNKGSVNGHTFFAVRVKTADGTIFTRVLQSDMQKDFTGRYGSAATYGSGAPAGMMSGFPHFRNLTFDARYPVAKLTFSEKGFPGTIVLTAFNPLIPLNSADSSIPAAFFRVSVENGVEDAEYTVVMCCTNPFANTQNFPFDSENAKGVTMAHADIEKDDPAYGDMTLSVAHKNAFRETYWYRGGWQDGIATFWRTFAEGTLRDRQYDTAAKGDHCTVGFSSNLKQGQSDSADFVLSWNIPNQYNYWIPCKDEAGNDRLWKNYYATVYADSAASCRYAIANFDRLLCETTQYIDALFSSTADEAILDAVSATLSVLKSPTALRLEDGSFYGWEGVNEHTGSCEGTCIHVWSYAYAMCFLFPDLERSIRELEIQYNMLDNGDLRFRLPLPVGREQPRFRACVDGTMATVIKIYREWKISGDAAWLKGKYDAVKKLLSFAWNETNPDKWDSDMDGVLEGRQHHTLDMELFGPSGWLEGMYLAALKAGIEMAKEMDDTDNVSLWQGLFDKGYAYTKEHLFNGKWFIQNIDLSDKAIPDRFHSADSYWNEEAKEIKYQIGEGCEIDQMLGQWHADIVGLGNVFDPQQKRIACRNVFQNNFKQSLREFANPWRVFALNNEAGAIICDYPEGAKKPAIPIPYCEETMHGFAYALAGLLLGEGMQEESLAIVRSIRNLYDGEKRNPWNEIECGSNYARSMASFALLPILSGFSFDLPHGKIGFAPKQNGDFRCLFSLGTGWGVYDRKGKTESIILKKGSLKLQEISLSGKIKSLAIDGNPVSITAKGNTATFDKTIVTTAIIAEME